jgi:[ribosomal protein S5]-alanine N-acetyltransferase
VFRYRHLGDFQMIDLDTFTIQTKRFVLSIIEEKDQDDLFETMNNPHTANIISFLKWPMTQEQASQICKRSIKAFAEQSDFFFLARSKEDASPAGYFSLEIEDAHTAEVGYWVSENWKGKGCATEMLKALIEWSFKQKNLSRLVATAAFENSVSLKVLQKQGFQIIGKKDLATVKGTTLNCHLLELKKNSCSLKDCRN